jgi:8-oxo-dGTP pyrophosphatase MutT (NUDIX family)
MACIPQQTPPEQPLAAVTEVTAGDGPIHSVHNIPASSTTLSTTTNPTISTRVESDLNHNPGVWMPMEALLCRFVVNLPEVEFQDWNRIFYHLERMWWFNLDQWTPSLSRSKKLYYANHRPSFEMFAATAIAHLDTDRILTREMVHHLTLNYDAYKRTIPVSGCVLLKRKVPQPPAISGLTAAISKNATSTERSASNDMTVDTPDCSSPRIVETLMIRPAGCPRWAFPKGKWNCGETAKEAAVRETAEETGFQLNGTESSRLSESWLVSTRHSNQVQLFPLWIDRASEYTDTPAHPTNHREVDDVRWIPVSDPPSIPLTQIAQSAWPKLLQFASRTFPHF